MKNFLLLVFSLIIFNVSHGQITPDNFNLQINGNITLTNGGYKFKRITNDSLILYNTDFSVFKVFLLPPINLPSPYPNTTLDISYISDNLFDNDSAIEFIGSYKSSYSVDPQTNHDTAILALIDEVNGISQIISSTGGDSPSFFPSSFYSLSLYSDGVNFAKIAVAETFLGFPSSLKYYTLPGLPACGTCSGSLSGITPINSGEAAEWILFPNPSTSTNEINISADVNYPSKTYVVSIYNVLGDFIKSSKIVNPQASIKINTIGFNAGTYFCHVIDDNNKLITVKKFIISK